MSSAVKAKLTTKVMTNWMILTTSMGFQALRKEGCRRRSGARERLRRLRTPALRTDIDQRDKCDSRRPQPQRLNKGTKKEVIASIKIRLCVLHSGAAARIRPAESGHRGQQGLVRTDEFDSKVTNLRKNPQEPSQQKEKHFSASNYPPDKTRGKETRLPDHHNKPGSFSHLLPHSARRRVIQFVRTPLRFALTPARVYAHSAVLRLLPSPFTSYPYSIQNVTIRGERFAFVRSSPSSPEKSNSSHRLFSCKASSVRRLHIGELLHFSFFTGIFTRITLILCNLRPVDCSKLGEAKNGSPSPVHFLYSIGNERIRSQCVKR